MTPESLRACSWAAHGAEREPTEKRDGRVKDGRAERETHFPINSSLTEKGVGARRPQ